MRRDSTRQMSALRPMRDTLHGLTREAARPRSHGEPRGPVTPGEAAQGPLWQGILSSRFASYRARLNDPDRSVRICSCTQRAQCRSTPRDGVESAGPAAGPTTSCQRFTFNAWSRVVTRALRSGWQANLTVSWTSRYEDCGCIRVYGGFHERLQGRIDRHTIDRV